MSNIPADPISPTKPKETTPGYQLGGNSVETTQDFIPPAAHLTGGTINNFQKPDLTQTSKQPTSIKKFKEFFHEASLHTPPVKIEELFIEPEGNSVNSTDNTKTPDKREIVRLATEQKPLQKAA